jgi:hypothetical protein
MKQFTLTEEQYEKAKVWMEERAKYSGAIGGQFSFVFTPTSLGIGVSVTDGKDSLNLTDYSKW